MVDKIGRRTSQDLQWQEVKKKVYSRDKSSCRLCKILTPSEYMILRKNAGSYLNIIDPAHYIEVSSRPDLCYKSYNICCLNRYSHSNLDGFKDPLDGHNITKEEAYNWWLRILKGDSVQYNYLKKKGLLEE